MEIPKPWMPLLVTALRDAVRYNQQLLQSETLHDRDDYEEHLLYLSQFFEYVKQEYQKQETNMDIPLKQLL